MFGLFKRSNPNSNWSLLQSLGFGVETSSGKTVNAETAQSLPAVYCAVSTIAEAIASLPIHIYQKRDNNERERVQEHYLDKLLNRKPNGYQTSYDFMIALMRSILLRGNGYAYIDYDRAGRVAGLHWLHPDSVIIKKLSTKRIGYQVAFDNGDTQNLLQEQILHIKYHSDDGITGKSPIQVCRESIGLGLAQQEFGAVTFKNSARPSGILTTDNEFSDKGNAIKRLSDEWNSKFSGSKNVGKTPILENGLKWQSISLSNVDAEWLESRNFSVVDVARMFKLRPIFLMDYSHSTFNNHSEAQRSFLSQSLRPWLTNIQSALNDCLVSERNSLRINIEFETKDLLRGSTAERFEVYDTAIRNGIMNPNECRRAENLAPREGGDEYSQSWIQKGQVEPNGGEVDE